MQVDYNDNVKHKMYQTLLAIGPSSFNAEKSFGKTNVPV